MAEGYVFYCSRCKIDHAGECAVVEEKPLRKGLDGYPSLGTRWVLQDWDFNNGTWTQRRISVPGDLWYQVVALDPNTNCVLADTHTPSSKPFRQYVPVSAFRNEGVDNPGSRYRMREIP